MIRLSPALVAGLLATLPAAAQDRPTFFPTRDVSVTYRASGGQEGVTEMRMSYLTAEKKLRVDLPGGIGWSIVDQPAQKMTMVMDAQRMIMEMPAQAAGPGARNMFAQPSETARFTRGASATVAGVLCTSWRYEDGPSRGEACVTADGVMLRSTGSNGGQGGTLEATAVAYGPQDPARFRPPAGYQVMQMPSGMGGGRPPAR